MASTFGSGIGNAANSASEHTQNLGSSANQTFKHGLNRGSETGDSGGDQGQSDFGQNVDRGRSYPSQEKQGVQQNFARSPDQQQGPSGGPTQTQDYEYGGQGATGYGDSGIQGSSGYYGDQQTKRQFQRNQDQQGYAGTQPGRGYGPDAGTGYQQQRPASQSQQQPVSSQPQGGTSEQSPRFQQAQQDAGYQQDSGFQQQPYRQQRGSESSQDSTSDLGQQGGRKRSKY